MYLALNNFNPIIRTLTSSSKNYLNLKSFNPNRYILYKNTFQWVQNIFKFKVFNDIICMTTLTKTISHLQISNFKWATKSGQIEIIVIRVLVNAMHPGRSGYSWEFNRINIPITQIWLNYIQIPEGPQNALHLPKLR